jgi:hypothetical protein
VLLIIAGALNIIYGIGAISDAKIFVGDQRYIFTNLHAMGWWLVIVGLIQLTGGFSLWSGNTYGRIIGVVGGTIGAITALLSIGGKYPWWSLGIFLLCIYIVQGILEYDEEAVART